MKFVSLFSGIGGIDLGLEWAGMECVAQVESDEFCLGVLSRHWPSVPRYKDIYEVDPYELPDADLIVGGFPCQTFSHASPDKGSRADGSLWRQMFRIVQARKPRWVLVENVVGIIYSYLDKVAVDLEGIGYEVGAFSLPASSFGAPHFRERVFVVAFLDEKGLDSGGEGRKLLYHQCDCWSGRDLHVADSGCVRFDLRNEEEFQAARQYHQVLTDLAIRSRWFSESGVGRVADGIPRQVDRIRSLGNAVVPQVAYFIGSLILLTDRLYVGSGM